VKSSTSQPLIVLLAAIPLPLVLLAVLFAGAAAGAAVNWAVYAWAWNRRAISPWSPADEKAPPRRASDRIPVLGWWGLRREEPLHGPRFWVRPALVELFMGVGWAALWWWEVNQQGLLTTQFAALAEQPIAAGALRAPLWVTWATFCSHAILVALMAAASLIDIDEKTIPDEITVPGTLIGLALAAVMPMAILPHAAIRAVEPVADVRVELPPTIEPKGGALYVEPTTIVAPNEWPATLAGYPNWRGLTFGLGCYAAWCFALAPRRWRGRRGAAFALRILLARAFRSLARPPLVWIALAGAVGIAAVWYAGGAAWIGLLTALVGMIGGGAMVWAVRKAGTWALRREALGFGDVTLMMMVGSMLGWQAGVVIFFLSPFAALVVGLLQLVLRRDDEIFYGPFLCLATLGVIVRWADLWNAQSPVQQAFATPWLVLAVLAIGVILLWAMLVLWRSLKELLFRAEHA
jgi:prepilin signal peptidase PulO-like enzyme (type II secretory pathway)